ncbi:MAG: thiamine pyrophosphate-dependent enzyme, partial [bacterium]
FDEIVEKEALNNNFAIKLPVRDELMNKYTVKGSQFQKPLFEFSGACAGCGETPYYKLATQLFGDRMVIANATGCSSIYGGTAPNTPFCKDKDGNAPVWANSLFEDNAEYGYGMALACRNKMDRIESRMKEVLENDCKGTCQCKTVSEDLKDLFKEWIENKNNADRTKELAPKIKYALEEETAQCDALDDIYEHADYLIKKSVWSVGGDGWAYDIGYGGLDHVIASGEDINILVLDTEVYSNTGGQSSKASQLGQVAKFAASGKKLRKKNLGVMAMTYGYVYVASVAMGANYNQLVKAMKEAEQYNGPSLIIAYSPCINHGCNMSKSQKEMKLAVETGYWPLYRYNPDLKKDGKNPFVLDSKEPSKKVKELIEQEVRYTTLRQGFPEEAERLQKLLQEDVDERWKQLKNFSENGF